MKKILFSIILFLIGIPCMAEDWAMIVFKDDNKQSQAMQDYTLNHEDVKRELANVRVFYIGRDRADLFKTFNVEETPSILVGVVRDKTFIELDRNSSFVRPEKFIDWIHRCKDRVKE